jgi:hypothetical protein
MDPTAALKGWEAIFVTIVEEERQDELIEAVVSP